MKIEIAERANSIISDRRLKAENESQIRYEKITEEIPEIADIFDKMHKNGERLIKLSIAHKLNDSIKQSIINYDSQAKNAIAKLLTMHGYIKDYLEIHYTCKICEDTGYHNGKRCECFKKICAQLVAKNVNDTIDISDFDFRNFNLNYYKGKTASNGKDAYWIMKEIYEYCFNYAKSFYKGSESILMMGGAGLGKTHLSLSIAKNAIRKGYTVIYNTAINLFMQIEKEHFSREREEDTLTLIQNEAELLIIDDLGNESGSEFTRSQLFNIINTRMNKNLPTIINTNLSLDGIKKKYDERIASRLFTYYKILKFEGEDIRYIKRKEEN